MDIQERKISCEKLKGRFYTPKFIVENILDMSGYCGDGILKKHVMENSCGDGAFLVEIVKRYCESAMKRGFAKEEIALDLGKYIHGIEIDENECAKCIKNVSAVARAYNVGEVAWDIICADAMDVNEYDGKMDFVLGNPPYVRVHNVGDAFDRIKQYAFARSGMTDYYLVFYEIGLKMLNKSGVLGYITPSSFFNSIAGYALRNHLVSRNLIDRIVDLKHFQAFAATTYNAIVILKKGKQTRDVRYYQYDGKNKIPYYIDDLTPNDFYICKNFYFANKDALKFLRKVFDNSGHFDVEVKNGFATLCDDVFIGDFDFDSPFIIPAVKASTGQTTRIFYPYGKDSKLVPECELQKEDRLYHYLLSHEAQLKKRSSPQGATLEWYAYGRSQAINDTYKSKLAVNNLLRDPNDLKMVLAPAGVGVYGGLYLVGDRGAIERAREVLASDDFAKYVALLGKYKSGGYYTYSSRDVKTFIDYKLAYDGGQLI